jgi:hypothetical protein
MKILLKSLAISIISTMTMMSFYCPNNVTNAGKIFIKSYSDLVRNQATNACSSIPEMHCNKYYVPRGNFNGIDSLSKTSFTSYFRTDPNHFSYNAFGTPICTDSLVDTNGNRQFMEMWRSVYSDNCPVCFPDRKWLPKKKYANWEWQRVIFVPIVKYKAMPCKYFNGSDFDNLQANYAINPQKMTYIGEPYLEPCGGYLSMLSPVLKRNRLDKKSITGLICKVLTRESPNGVLCYVFNKESFGTSSPHLNWKN